MKSRNTNSNKFSVLIPTYEESRNLSALTKSLEDTLSHWDFDVVFIDDNSPDGTAERIRELSVVYDNLKLLVRPEKNGLGSAYKDGFKVSSGNTIVQMDADLSHNPEELTNLFKALENADVVVGSRCVPGGRVIGWKWYRTFINRGANLLARLVLGVRVRDATSGFRAYDRKAFEEIVSNSSMNGFDFQVEAVYIAKRLGLKVVEVPITFANRKRGKSKLSFKEVVNFAKAVFKIRFRRWEGRHPD